MSELLLRGYNVAVPSVDSGDDMYVTDSDANLMRVQVKSANCKKKPYGFCGQVRVRFDQLFEVKKTPLIYIFALRWSERWYYITIHREDLLAEHELHNAGAVKNDYIWFRFKFYDLQPEDLPPEDPHPNPLPEYREREFVTCSDRDFTRFLGWEKIFPMES